MQRRKAYPQKKQPIQQPPANPAIDQAPEATDSEWSPLREVLLFEDEVRLDLEKALRAIGFLLEWGCEIGNEHIDPISCQGLGRLLYHAADETRYLYTINEIENAGGDLQKVREARR